MTENQILTVKEIATYLRVSPMTVLRLLEKNAIPGFKVGRQWRVARAKLEQMMAGRPS